jgi:hypothetical protein
MTKIFEVIPIELRPGANEGDFERFWIEEFASLGRRLDWVGHLARSDRGERDGRYAVIWEIPSVELRDRYYSARDEPTQEMLNLLESDFKGLVDKLFTFVEEWPFTDYVEIEK